MRSETLQSMAQRNVMLETASRLTGRPVYDRKDLLIQQQKAAILALVRGYDTGNISAEDVQKARELLG